MAAETTLAEWLARIEHKMDILLSRYPSEEGESMPKLGAPNVKCPVCEQAVSFTVDVNDSVVVRKCGCSTGKIALDLKAFAPPVSPARKTDNGSRDDEQEDRNDSRDPSRRSQWR